MRITPRAEWRARAPKYRPTSIPLPTPRLWLHHTAVEWHGPIGARQTQNYHMDTKGWNDLGYSFLVDDDGTVYEGRGAGVLGAHTEGDNDESHAIACMGDFTRRDPSQRMLDSIVDLAVHGHQAGWWPARITGGHRDAPGAQTACPGDRLHLLIPDLNRRITSLLGGVAPTPAPSREDLLMPAALDDNDARRCLIRDWCWRFWGHAPTVEEQQILLYHFGTQGADLTLAHITDHPKAKR